MSTGTGADEEQRDAWAQCREEAELDYDIAWRSHVDGGTSLAKRIAPTAENRIAPSVEVCTDGVTAVGSSYSRGPTQQSTRAGRTVRRPRCYDE